MEMYGTVQVALRNKLLETKWSAAHDEQPTDCMLRQFEYLEGDLLVDEINRFVNKNVEYRSERTDEWSGVRSVLARGYGDCEDYAIAKYQLLRACGFDTHSMWIVVGRQLIARQDHALLVIVRDGETVALDNSTSYIIKTADDPDFVPVCSLNEHGSWVHGKPYKSS